MRKIGSYSPMMTSIGKASERLTKEQWKKRKASKAAKQARKLNRA